MALDDFTSDDHFDPPEGWEDTKEQLKQNTPPSEADGWIEHEPGAPDWLGFIESDEYEVDKSDLQDDDPKNMLFETGEGVRIRVAGVSSTRIVCTNPYSLDNMR